MKVCVITTLFLFLTSCSFINSSLSSSNKIKKSKKNDKLTDKSGSFKFIRQSGYSKKNNAVIVKSEIIDRSEKALEQIITFSNPGKINKGLSVLRPSQSQY